MKDNDVNGKVWLGLAPDIPVKLGWCEPNQFIYWVEYDMVEVVC